MNFTNVVYFIFLSNLILISSNSLFDFSSFSSGRNSYHKISNDNNNKTAREKETNSQREKVKTKIFRTKKSQKNLTNVNKTKKHKKKELKSINKIPTLALVSFFSEELNKTIIDSSIVYWLKSGGARLIIIDQNFPEIKLQKIFKYVNAFIIQDYPTLQGQISNYEKFVEKLTNKLIEINYPENKQQLIHRDFMPLFGIGTGANLIQSSVANSTKIIKPFKNIKNSNKKIELIGPLKKIRWISHFDKRDYLNLIKKTNTFYSSNNFVDYKYYLKNISLRRYLKITGLTKDTNGDNFVAMFEGNKVPFYGISFNPEKTIWKKFPENKKDKKDEKIIENSPLNTNNVITLSQKFLNFIINTARKNKNKFDDLKHIQINKNSEEVLKMKDIIDFDFTLFTSYNKFQKEKITEIRVKHHLKEDKDLLKLIAARKKILKKLFSENDEFFFVDSATAKKLNKKHKHKNHKRNLKEKEKKMKLEEKYRNEKYQKINKKSNKSQYARFVDEKRTTGFVGSEISNVKADVVNNLHSKKNGKKRKKDNHERIIKHRIKKIKEETNEKFMDMDQPLMAEFISVKIKKIRRKDKYPLNTKIKMNARSI